VESVDGDAVGVRARDAEVVVRESLQQRSAHVARNARELPPTEEQVHRLVVLELLQQPGERETRDVRAVLPENAIAVPPRVERY
jgi:hypothetical protein